MPTGNRPSPALTVHQGRLGWILLAGVLAVLAFRPPQEGSGNTRPRRLPSFGGMASDSNNRMVAVTGLDITGQSVLYVVDTESMNLCVYQASGGSASTQGIKLVGARNISLDMQLDGFNDQTQSEGRPLGFKDLEEQFRDSGLLPDESED